MDITGARWGLEGAEAVVLKLTPQRKNRLCEHTRRLLLGRCVMNRVARDRLIPN
jgi:hypothetical protein